MKNQECFATDQISPCWLTPLDYNSCYSPLSFHLKLCWLCEPNIISSKLYGHQRNSCKCSKGKLLCRKKRWGNTYFHCSIDSLFFCDISCCMNSPILATGNALGVPRICCPLVSNCVSYVFLLLSTSKRNFHNMFFFKVRISDLKAQLTLSPTLVS